MVQPIIINQHERAVRRALFPPILAMGVLIGLLLWQILELRNAAEWVSHTDAVIAQANQTLKLIVDMQTGERGYLISGNPLFLEPYKNALTASDRHKNINRSFEDLAGFVNDNSDQTKELARIRATYQLFFQNAEYEIGLKREKSPQLLPYFSKAQGKKLMDDLRVKFDAFIETERILLVQRKQKTDQQTAQTLIGGFVFSLLFGTLLFVNTRRQMRFLSDEHEKILEAEEAARQNLSITLTSIGDGVLVTDAAGNITLLNEVAEKLTGWTNREAVTKPSAVVFDIVNETTRELVESPVTKVLREGSIAGLANHTVLRRRDGTDIPIDDSGAPIRGKDGKLSGVVVVFRDISERKQLEQEILAGAAKQSRIAETLQQSLLLTPPKGAFEGLEVSTLYAAAWEEAQVGGDFFDALSLGDNRVALIIGDVTGKGLVAASHTAEIKFALRAFLFEDSNPAATLQRLNRFLVEGQRLGKSHSSFVSVLVCVINTVTGAAGFANGGSELPIIVRADSGIEEIPVTGAVLGASGDIVYDLFEQRLEPGDTLLFTTDGITEARAPNRRFFGTEGLKEALLSIPSNSDLDGIAQSIYTRARDFAEGRLQDDACLLVARRKPFDDS